MKTTDKPQTQTQAPSKPERKKLSAQDHIQAVADGVLRGYIRLQTASRLLHGPDRTALEETRRKFLGLVSDLNSVVTSIEVQAKGDR